MSRKKKELEFWLYYEDPKTRFIRLGADLVNSKKFCKMSNGAQLIYIRMALFACGKSSFTFPFSVWQSFISKSAFSRAKQELIQNGFIRLTENGSNTRTPNRYEFCSDWKRQTN